MAPAVKPGLSTGRYRAPFTWLPHRIRGGWLCSSDSPISTEMFPSTEFLRTTGIARPQRPSRLRVGQQKVAIVEAVVVVPAERVRATETWRHVEGHHIDMGGIREDAPAMEGQDPPVAHDRYELQALLSSAK